MICFDRLSKMKPRLYAEALGRRIYTEVLYLYEVARANDRVDDALFNEVIERLSREPLCLALVEQCEALLAPLKADDTLKEVLYVAHSHIDMNWMWGYDETVAITLATFRTTLDMMKEYPFTFGQSQASCYEIVEKYDPDMLSEIRERIKEGRWEVTASSWVETDRNMPAQETHIRQLYFTKQYLSALLGLDESAFRLSYEPDTFGHNAFSPDVLSAGGVRWMYHCRGYEGEFIYNWRSRSGASILCYREPLWYISGLDENDLRSNLRFFVGFAKRYGLDRTLQVYGVGDHGGGVTRGELKMIEEMRTYPLIPTVKYGTYREFFEYLEQKRDAFPTVEGELNPVFDGCYTTQARVKHAYKLTEGNLLATEACNALSVIENGRDLSPRLSNAWHNLMFCTFHDILPGSNERNSRQYALGILQEASAASESTRTLALRGISERIDLTRFQPYLTPAPESALRADGAGVGYGKEERATYDISRCDGKGRAYAVYNTLPFARDICITIPVYDWDVDYERLEAIDGDGNICPLQQIDRLPISEWLHSYVRLAVRVKVPPMGYQVLLLREKENLYREFRYLANPRVQKELDLTLSGAGVTAAFRTSDLALENFTIEGKSILPSGSGYFEFAKEDPHVGMTAWRIGRLYEKQPLSCLRLAAQGPTHGEVREELGFLASFGRSSLKATAKLENGILSYAVTCDWREEAEFDRAIPHLAFRLPLREGARVTKQVNEPVAPSEVGFAAAHSVCVRYTDGSGFILVAKDKYGFSYEAGVLSLLLLRTSFDPDRTPDYGEHKTEFALIPFTHITDKEIDDRVRAYTAPLLFTSLSGRGEGDLPLSKSYLHFASPGASLFDCHATDQSSTLVKIRDWSGEGADGVLYTDREMARLEECDLMGNPYRAVTADKKAATLSAPPHGMRVYKIT